MKKNVLLIMLAFAPLCSFLGVEISDDPEKSYATISKEFKDTPREMRVDSLFFGGRITAMALEKAPEHEKLRKLKRKLEEMVAPFGSKLKDFQGRLKEMKKEKRKEYSDLKEKNLPMDENNKEINAINLKYDKKEKEIRATKPMVSDSEWSSLISNL